MPVIAVAGSALGRVIAKPVELLLSYISKPFIAVYNYNKNVESLKKKAEELKVKLKTVDEYEKLYVDRRGEVIGNDLQTWQVKTKELMDEAGKVFADDEENAKKNCFSRLCLNSKSRYKLSKKAAQNSESIAEQLRKASEFSLPHAYAPAPVEEVASAVRGFQDFGSRRGILGQIMEELQSTGVSKIGLYGMPGAGKSMLVKEIKRKAEEDKLFEKVVLASVTNNPVTNNPDLKRIQREIARGLGMDQLGEGLEVRDIANRINARLRKMKTVLVILDDVWTELNLVELGVAFDEMNSDGGESLKSKNLPSSETGSFGKECMNWKVLFTSRDRNVLKIKMGSQKEFEIVQLTKPEAWEMFKKIAGERVESDRGVQPIANGIVEECDGLPLAISALANALKDQDLPVWKNALTRLRKPSSYNFTGISESVYAAIEVSYDRLRTNDLKQIFLLSSMMGKNASIRDILKYSAGLGLFPQATTIDEARDELLTLISHLKAATLLIDGSIDEWVSMHDLIWDVAISIAHRDRHGLFLQDSHVPKEWSDMEAVKEFKWISFKKTNVNGMLPDTLESYQLAFFHIDNEDPSLAIPTNIFNGMQILKVLDLSQMNMPFLPSSVSYLRNLHTLCLDRCVLSDMSIIGELKSLEILSLMQSDFEKLPAEIKELTRLQLLDLSGCEKLAVIPPNVLGNLSRLEELYLANSFDRWELEEHNEQRNASLVELKLLKNLITLEVRIGDLEMIPRDMIFRDLKRYKIIIGDVVLCKCNRSFHSSRILRLKLQKDRAPNLYYSVKQLPFQNTEELHLEGLNGVKNLVDELDEDGFQDLKYLFIRNSPDVEKIISSARNALPALEVLLLHQLIKLEKIFHGRFLEMSFLKLREIDVSCCDQLKNLFSSAIAKQLQGLQEIRLTECKFMEAIVDDEEKGSTTDIVGISERDSKPEFGKQLRVLLLKHLPKLSSWNSSCGSRPFFNDQVVLPNLVELQLSWINDSRIWETNLITSSCVENLTKLIIEGCHNLKYLFTSTVARGMPKLVHLEIRECRRMEEIVLTENIEVKEDLVFLKLSFLLIKDLQCLVRFYSGNCIVEFRCLKHLEISNCPDLKGFTPEAVDTDDRDGIHLLFNEQVMFPKLETLVLYLMKSLGKIWDAQLLEAHSFLHLKWLRVISCEKLLNIFPSNMLERLININKLQIWHCDMLEGIFDRPQMQGVIPQSDQIATVFTSSEAAVKIKFPSLMHLQLHMLPKLKWFFPQECTLEFPVLTKLEVDGCDQVQIFASECSSFHRVTEDNQQGNQVQWPLFWVDKATFSNLEELELEKNDLMKEIWCGQDQAGCLGEENGEIVFTKLKYLQLNNLHRLVAFCSYSCSFGFPSLENMIITGCPRMESFSVGESQTPKLKSVKQTKDENQGLWKGDLNATIQELFAQKVGYSTLEHLKLVEFPELISNWNKTHQDILSVGKLKSIEVCNINSLRYLFTPTMALELVQLEVLKVTHCEMTEEVIIEDGSQEIIFPKLKQLWLMHLPKLARFCSENYLKFPSLFELEIGGCPVLKTFISSSEKDKDSNTLALFNAKVALPKLERLIMASMESLNKIWEDQLEADAFCELNYLSVRSCEKLLNVFPSNMLERLININKLQIWHCDMLEGIFDRPRMQGVIPQSNQIATVFASSKAAVKIKFPSLMHLQLHMLPKLKWFFPQECTLEFPMLTKLEVDRCDQVQIFASECLSFHRVTEDNQQGHQVQWPLFWVDKATFSNLEELKLEKNDLMKEIWCGQDQAGCLGEEKGEIVFTKLKYLQLNNLHRLGGFCSYNCGFGFPSLENVIITGCPRMESFSMRESKTPKLKNVKWTTNENQGLWKGDLNATIQELFARKVGYSTLEHLKLVEFPELISNWNKTHQDILSVGKLKSIEVCNINSLRYLFTPTMALELVQLEELKVTHCEMMEEVIIEDGSQEIIFSKLVTLMLEDLPELTKFYSENYVKFPSLVGLGIVRCPVLKTFISSSEKDKDSNTLALFNAKVALPKLEQLIMASMESLNKIWEDQLEAEAFCELNYLSVASCQKLLNVFPSNMVERLINIKKIEIWHCHMLEGIFDRPQTQGVIPRSNQIATVFASSEAAVKIKFPSLMHLQLHLLPKLKWFFPQECTLEFPMLTKLEVDRCDQVQIFASECLSFHRVTEDNQQGHQVQWPLFWVDKATFSNLEELKLEKNDLMKEIWCGQDQAGCLGQEKAEIVFTKLKYLQLNNLHRLGGFCSYNCSFGFPALENVIITGCPRMESFSMGESQTPKLENVKWATNENQGLWKGDLNATIQELFARKVGYSTLEHLKLVEFPELISNWNMTHQDILSVGKLKSIEVRNINSLRYLFTPTMALELVQLEVLKVTHCEMTEEVIIEDGSQEIIFPKLKQLWLMHLPKLARFCSENYLKFPSLFQLAIEGCPVLKTFISSSEKDKDSNTLALFNAKVALPKLEQLIMASMESLNKIWEDQLEAEAFCELNYLSVASCQKLLNVFPSNMVERLINIKKIEIWHCDMLEWIFDRPQTQGVIPRSNQIATVFASSEAAVKIKFPSLRHLQLHLLPKLKWFFPQECTLEFPMLTKLEVVRCDQVQIFATECSSFHRVTEDNQQGHQVQWPLFWVDKATFSSLEELKLEKNDLMKEIWCEQEQAGGLGEVKGEIVFTKLKHLQLNNLPRLRGFCSYNCRFGFPSLENLIIIGCPRMESFSVGESQTPKLENVKWTTDENQGLWKGDLNATIQELFAQKVGYSTLEHLKLVEFPELISIWIKTPQDILSVGKLKSIEVCNINSLGYLFTPTMALELVQLEVLKVTHCEMMEEVIIEDGSQEIIFPKLKQLWLRHLPKLARFCSENYLKFPSLFELAIDGCPVLKTFISSSEKDKDSNIVALFNSKVALPKLKALIMASMGSLNKIWDDQLEADAFCELNYLHVESCEKLLNIFSYDMLKRFQKLDRVRIRNCRLVEEILEYKGHGASDPHAQPTTFVDAMDFTLKFPNLTHLELYMLPKFKRVFPGVLFKVECPSLKLLQVNGCDEVQIFASEYPGFQIPSIEISPRCPLFWVTKGTFPSLTALILRWNNNMKDLWCGQDPSSFFPRLMHIELIGFPEQSDQLLPSYFVRSLPEFRELVVNGVSREKSQEDKASSSQQVH